MNDYTLYILMRNDLPSMSPGRKMAQASHASNAFIHECKHHKEIKKWQTQTTQGFGTAIVLAAQAHEISTILNSLKESKCIYSNTVIDPDYVIPVSPEVTQFIDLKHVGKLEFVGDNRDYLLHRVEMTCAYVFGSKTLLKPILGELPLHP